MHYPGKLRILPLGGLGEIGKNMMLIQYENDSIIIDAGIMFPENDMLGIDYIIPDFQYVIDQMEEGLIVHGIIITHGHEDHTGAIGHVLDALPVPVYATALTAGLLEIKMRQFGHTDHPLHIFKAGDVLRLGPFSIETFHVCHSIPDGVGLGINTPIGLIVHSSDFKFDHTPVDGWPPDFARLAEFAQRGVLALLSDSTNADQEGWTPSERVIDRAFDEVFARARGRIIVATFASLISRIQQVAQAAQKYDRKMAVAGHSMVEYIKVASKLGYLKLPPDLMVPVDRANKMPPHEIVIMATGTQGEPSAVLGRLAWGEHRQLEIEHGDTVIMSAHPIPGNEELVHRTINKLIQRGAGHARQEELKLIHTLVKPRFFIPVHGEYRHLHQHARLAEAMGMPESHIHIPELGEMIEFSENGMNVAGTVPAGSTLIDGLGIGDVGAVVLKDRKHLAEDGLLIVVMGVDHDRQAVVSGPDIISRGFVYMREADELVEGARNAAKRAIDSFGPVESTDWNHLKNDVRDAVQRYIYEALKRNPMILPIIVEI